MNNNIEKQQQEETDAKVKKKSDIIRKHTQFVLLEVQNPQKWEKVILVPPDVPAWVFNF